MSNRLKDILSLVRYEEAKYRHHQLYLIAAVSSFAESIKDSELEEACEREVLRLKELNCNIINK